MSTWLLTGLPRSGTTLACACLNALPNWLALAEPLSPPDHGDADRFLAELQAYITVCRTRVLINGRVGSKTVDGELCPTNWFEPPTDDGQLRATRARMADLPVGKPLKPDFNLVIKHPALFTGALAPLSQRFPLFAVVRDPLAVLASWQTVDIPVNRGRAPAAETFALGLKTSLDAAASVRDRQLRLLQWFFAAYATLPRERVIRYEDLIADPARALSPLTGARAPIDVAIFSKPPEARYPGIDLADLAHDLLPLSEVFRVFYPDIDETLAWRL